MFIYFQPDSAQPPRVDINVSMTHAAASSPKGRLLVGQHEQYQSMPSRMPQYTLAESVSFVFYKAVEFLY